MGQTGTSVFNVDTKRKPADAEWVSRSTRNIAQLPGYSANMTSDSSLSPYGGVKTVHGTATGFFHTQKINGRWWFIDPEGNGYISKALDCVSPGSSTEEKAAFQTKYSGSNKIWANSTRQLLVNNGFNGTGAWSTLNSDTPYPSTLIWGFASSYAKSKGLTQTASGHTGYVGNVLPIFNSDFQSFCESYASSHIPAHANNKYVLGHFSDNEMPLSNNCLSNYLARPSTDAGHVAAQKWLDAKKGHANASLSEATSSDKDEFRAYVADRYFSIVSKAIRHYDPNHMYFGSRFYSDEKNSARTFAVAGKYLDAVSINVYLSWSPTMTTCHNWESWSGKPFLVTEFYAKGMDSGLANIAGAGWVVKTQAERGYFYQNFVLALMESKTCVGWQLFRYQDEVNTATPNQNSNKGIVSNKYVEYSAYLNLIKAVNMQAYNLIKYFDGDFNVSISNLSPNESFTAPASITINASASIGSGSITKVEFYKGLTKLGEDTTAPYSFVWGNVAAGSYSLTVKAYNNAGGSVTSTPVSITVGAANQAPQVVLSSPVSTTALMAPAKITLQATASDIDGSISKVEFYSGTTLLGTATSAPYSYLWTNVAAGTYQLKAKAFDDKNLSTYSSSLSITVSAASQTQKVISYSLVNADTCVDIQTLADGATLNLATLPTSHLNIRADTNPGTVGSVSFSLSGAQNRTQVESIIPYALYGNNGSGYNPWTPAVGDYTLKATPFTGSKATGTAGASSTIAFKVINQPITSSQVTSFTLIDADKDMDIMTLPNGSTVTLSSLPTQHLNIRANTASTSAIGSVVFILTGAQIRTHTEEGAPYALYNNLGSNYSGWTPAKGNYTLKATPYSGSQGTGTAGTGLSVNFTFN